MYQIVTLVYRYTPMSSGSLYPQCTITNSLYVKAYLATQLFLILMKKGVLEVVFEVVFYISGVTTHF